MASQVDLQLVSVATQAAGVTHPASMPAPVSGVAASAGGVTAPSPYVPVEPSAPPSEVEPSGDVPVPSAVA